ncbi:MAG TPA: diguanylate cyclase [Solirubrobacteraceae bacterium]|nr:diguanylate cyclase [Solirubrobacteraceae bacterium]
MLLVAGHRTPSRRRRRPAHVAAALATRRAELAAALACPLLVLVLVPLGGAGSAGHVAPAVALQLGVAAALAAGRRRRAPRALGFAALLAFLLSVALLRDGGGPAAGYGVLVLVPVLWAALHGRGPELGVALVGAALVYAVPHVLVGGDRYPPEGARSGILLVALTGLAGLAVLRLVREIRAHTDHADAILDTMADGFALTCDGEIVAVNAALERITGLSRAQLLGARPPYPFSAPERLAETEAVRRRIVAEQGGRFEVVLARADGERFPAEVTATPSQLPDGSAAFLNTIRDVTALRAHEEQMRRRVEDLGAIAAVARAVARSGGADARRTICRVALDVTGAGAAAIFERGEDGALRTTCALGGPYPVVTLGPAERAHGAAVALATLAPVFVPDAASSPRCDARLVELLGIASEHFQPIGHDDEVRGVLAVSWHERRPVLSDHVAALLEVLAEEAAVALERADLLRRLDRLARTDDLTGLANRRAWEELLERELASAARTGLPVAVALIDLDRFKEYNDLYGHQAGDRVLREAASRWRERLRVTDVLARWGGEEFGLLLPGCDAACACELLERLRGLLPDGVTFSAGVAGWDGEGAADALVAAADAALYSAKQGGRDRTAVAARA